MVWNSYTLSLAVAGEIQGGDLLRQLKLRCAVQLCLACEFDNLKSFTATPTILPK